LHTHPEARLHVLARRDQDAIDALLRVADAVNAAPSVAPQRPWRPHAASSKVTAESLSAVIGEVLPENAILIDESPCVYPAGSDVDLFRMTAAAPPHDLLRLTGGAIGEGLSLALGAAVACPDRPVICVESDGAAMYAIQALWTHAREGLPITTVICSNRAYGILKHETKGLGVQLGPRAQAMLDLDRPVIDFVELARGMGVESSRAETVDEMRRAMQSALSSARPYLLEVVL
jgi:acetolactate synthase-1/2/3 large subunit